MVDLDRMQTHFTALLIDAEKNNHSSFTSFTLVADNPVAPKQVKSAKATQGLPRRSKSVGSDAIVVPRFSRRRNTTTTTTNTNTASNSSSHSRPRPTKKVPRRCRSAPCQILKRDTTSPIDPADCPRWNNDTSCGCAPNFHIKCSKPGSKAPPRVPRRSSDDDLWPMVVKINNKSSHPPRRPRRKRGDALVEPNAMPPRFPSRKPDLEVDVYGSIAA
ncbi:expressed unknown protein [Seminavis robusta]|uniref:Uncharacterized protein n=1 Tax=Seminavis robusta TaxID=568900 RepID=A0A9N8E560_9STRA|nr:expressed unknown protein [Seminavis robusta]|eukprot:Sro663_g183480.1 n/a (217) ;mRNA; f:19385-20035